MREPERKSTIRAWSWVYTPFIMGGNVHRTIACELPCEGPFHIGRGFYAYTVRSPRGQGLIVEATTGGIIGDNFDDVVKDVASADLKVVKKQLADEKERGGAAANVCAEKFWRLLRR